MLKCPGREILTFTTEHAEGMKFVQRHPVLALRGPGGSSMVFGHVCLLL